MNVISRKDIEYKKELFIMNGDEKPEQNIDLNIDNDTYILNFVSDYHNSSFNLSVYFNNSNDLILLKKEIIVQLKVKQFLEPEPLIVKSALEYISASTLFSSICWFFTAILTPFSK